MSMIKCQQNEHKGRKTWQMKDDDFSPKIVERKIESVKDTLHKPFTYERQTKSLTNPPELYRIL